MSDICFIAEERVIYAHMLVLFTKSSTLYELALVSKNKQLEIQDISYKLLFELLTFVYCGEMPCINHLDEVLLLLLWAKRLQLFSMIDKLESILFSMMNDKNLAIILLTAEKYDMKQLEIACILTLVNSRNLHVGFPFHHFSFKTLRFIAQQIFPPKKSKLVNSQLNSH